MSDKDLHRTKGIKKTPLVAQRLLLLQEMFESTGRGASVRMAQSLGITPHHWYNVLRGTSLGIALAQRIVRTFPGVSLDWLYLGRPEGLSCQSLGMGPHTPNRAPPSKRPAKSQDDPRQSRPHNRPRNWKWGTTPPKAPRAPRVPALNQNEERPEDCHCSALPRGSGPCLPCYVRRLRLAEACRLGDRRRLGSDGLPKLVATS
jgi:hypothetical protein